MPSSNLGWTECVTCCLTLLAPDMEEHIREKHSFEYLMATDTNIPYVKEGKLTAKLHTIDDVGMQPNNDSIKNHIMYLNPDTMLICKYKKGQPLLLDNKIILETYSDRSVPLGSVVVSNEVFYNTLSGVSQLVELQNLMIEQMVSAWICYVTISSSNDFDDPTFVFNIPQLLTGRKFICENESFVANCFGNVITVNIQSVVSKRNFETDTIGNITSALSFLTLSQKQKKLYLITEYTKFILVNQCKRKILKLNYIHGMDKVQNALMLSIERYYNRTSLVFDRGCIIHGAQGSGKSSLVEAMAEHYGLPIICPDFSNIFSQDVDSFVKNLNSFENQILKSLPCFVCFDNIENFCPIQILARHPNGFCIAEHFNTFLHSLSQMGCFVFGVTKDIHSIHPSLRFFEMVLEIPVPSTMDRFNILTGLMKHHDIDSFFSKDEIKRAANVAHGFSGYDLNKICIKLKTKSQSTREIKDLLSLVHKTVPSILREVAIESPNVKWEDVGGQEKLKAVLKWSIEKPIEDSSLFEGNITKGILLYGPPGCSKTMIVKALATECGLNFLWVQGSQLHGKYVGESEQAIKELFKRARNAAPCVIFFDELDAFAPKRGSGRDTAGVSDRCVSLLMTEMDGISSLKNVFIIAATNRPDHIDPALLRAGRFDTRLYVPLPNLDTRIKIIDVRCKKGNVDEDVDVKLLAEKTERYSCAEVDSLYEFAGNAAIAENEYAKKIKMKHFIEALSNMVPLTNPELLEWYEKLRFNA